MSVQYETFGKYVLLEKLATGGMAEVFLARGTGAGGIGKFFAIKRILPQYADSPEFIDMFKDEAKIAINLNHSNIVSIHEFGVEKGQLFLVMDYVEGRNLRQILNKMKKSSLQFSIDQVVYMVKEVASGLDHAHRCLDGTTGKPLNITHRDMSPQNLMVSFEGEVKVVDFGIAKAESQLDTTRAGTLKGKFGYMSPEQAEGQPVDLRTDIFSLGIVLWELLAGDRLFVANNEINTLRKIRECHIPSLRKINPNIPTELERIAQKALARDRNLRYQTAAAMHRDLNRFLNRQFPDFSSQDFSVFIKSIFADEILGIRKRLVEYSQINPTSGHRKSESEFDDRTSLLDTSTNSLVVSDSQVVADTQSSSEIATSPTNHNLDESSHSLVPSLSLSVSQLKSEPTKVASAPLPPTGEAEQTSSKGVLNIEAMAQALKSNPINPTSGHATPRVQPLENSPANASTLEPSPLEAELLTIPTPPSHITSGPRRQQYVKQQHNPPARIATFMVVLLLGFSVYVYLCKFYPTLMEPAIRNTYKFAPGLYDAILPARVPAAASTSPVTPTSDAPANATSTGNTARPFLEPTSNSLLVMSTPSGAEIWINNKNTGLTTPQSLQMSSKEAVTITLKRRGFVDFVREGVTRETLSGKLEANLVKRNVGYVDVEIFPPSEATVYVNGQKISLNKTLAKDIMVPAGQSVKIRAESATGHSYDEVELTLARDQKKSIRLNPRKISRE